MSKSFDLLFTMAVYLKVSRNKQYIKLINNAEQLSIRVRRSKLHQGMAVIYKKNLSNGKLSIAMLPANCKPTLLDLI